jgi:hypothetical protein
MPKGKKLFIRTTGGLSPVDPALAEKYGLRPGMALPFSEGRVVDDSGVPQEEAVPEAPERIDTVKGELVNDGIAQLDNGLTLSHSEMIDIAHAEDSKNG